MTEKPNKPALMFRFKMPDGSYEETSLFADPNMPLQTPGKVSPQRKLTVEKIKAND